jgi:hypothetical protein
MEHYHRNVSSKGRFVECYKWNFIKTNYTYSSIDMGFKGLKSKGYNHPKYKRHPKGAC